MKTFVVLGMHRSATSLAAQGLAKSGIFMGDRLLGTHESNPYGHWEDVDFIHFNDKLLSMAGGSWDDPPSKDKIKNLLYEKTSEIKAFIKSKEREPFWGWKDPRTVLTISLFMPFLQNPHFITCFRDPMEVARSLNKRDGMDIKKGLRLASIYNNRLIDFLIKFGSKYETYL
jgi:hypothetical protein